VAASEVQPAPPLAEAEKQAPAGTVPVAVAGATGEVPRTIYVEAPTPPKKKGNRGIGILISALATLVFTIVWAGVSAAILAVALPASEFAASYGSFIADPAWWVPTITFFLGLVIIVSILNRAGWAWYIVGGLFVGVLAYVGYLSGALISVAGQLSPAEVQGFLLRNGLNPLAIAVGITAREVSIWTGAAIAARGRRVKARNLEARAEFDRESAERRAEYERVRAGFAS
jgi:signal transduction histidine kinase